MEQQTERRTTPRDQRLRTLGSIQLQILRAVSANAAEAYGTAITDRVNAELGRDIPDAQIYQALLRLTDHGLVEKATDPTPPLSARSRGRPRVFYSLTSSGRRALDNAGTYAIETGPVMKQVRKEPTYDDPAEPAKGAVAV